MRSDTSNDVGQDKVKELFQLFQQHREHASQERQQVIMDKLHPTKITPLANGETEGEQVVVDQYRRFMSERDGGKEDIIAQLTAYAKSKVEAGVVEKNVAPKPVASQSRLTCLFQWFGHVLKGVAEGVSKVLMGRLGQWQLLLPALAMAAMVLWLTQIMEHKVDSSQTLAWNGSLPFAVSNNAQDILNKLQPEAQPTLGFTQYRGTLSTGFELGQTMAYVELALVAQSEVYLSTMVRRANNLANDLGLPSLGTQVDLQKDTESLDGIVQRWFNSSNELTAYYQLGYWMETTQFALLLTEPSGVLVPIEEQFTKLKAYRSEWGQQLATHPAQLRQFYQLAELDVSSLQTGYGRQMFSRQLERTIAAFNDL
jgi:hypothetical protein